MAVAGGVPSASSGASHHAPSLESRGAVGGWIPVLVHTAGGDVLDEICWRRYGRADAVPVVLAANPGLAEAAPVLPAGIPILFPDLPPAAPTMPAGRLWDVAPAWIVLPERRGSYVRLAGTFRAGIRAGG